MIVVAGQREWVAQAYNKDPVGSYAQSIGCIRTFPKGSKVFFVHWSDKVPDDVIRDYICIGFHMTDLPFGRGGSPLQNLIMRGIYKTKLTAFRLSKSFDAGNILLKRDFEIDKMEPAKETYARVSMLAIQMIKEIEEKRDYVGVPQGISKESFKRRKPEQSRLESLQYGNAQTTCAFIRMLDAPDYPHAFIGGATWKIEFTDAEIVEGRLTAKATFKWLEL